nr:calcineurin-like metallo-phosphoesterase superfamily protein [Tanacetum cinerariifolium]
MGFRASPGGQGEMKGSWIIPVVQLADEKQVLLLLSPPKKSHNIPEVGVKTSRTTREKLKIGSVESSNELSLMGVHLIIEHQPELYFQSSNKAHEPKREVVGNDRGTVGLKEPQAFAGTEIGNSLNGTPKGTAQVDVKNKGNSEETTNKDLEDYTSSSDDFIIALGNILKFRKKNWQFNFIGGFIKFILTFSMFPLVKGRQADTQPNIYNIDLDHTSKVLSMQEDLEVQEVVEVMNAAKLITEVVTAVTTQVIPAAEPVVAAVSTPISAAKPKGLKVVPAAPTVSTRKRKGVVIRDPEEELHDDTPAKTQSAKDKGKGIFVEDPKPMKKKDQISMDAEYARKLHEEEESLAQAKDAQVIDDQPKDAPAKGIQYIKRYHGYKKKPQSESQACKNMIDYLKNIEGFKMAFFKGKTYDQIRPIFQARFDANMSFLLKSKEEMEKEEEEIIKSINETPAQKAAKRRRLREEAKEAEELKKQLEVVADEDDDVFIEATPIGTKVPVVNYEIVMINNKPRYKIFRADDTHQLYTSFITLLKNFDREDLEDLWKIVKTRFSTCKPTNWTADYLLATLKNMFEKTDAQDVLWRSQQTEHGQALVKSWKLLTSCRVHINNFTTTMFVLLVEKKYPLSRFTLEQLVNVARLQVEEDSEMSLELLRFTRQQLLEYQQE